MNMDKDTDMDTWTHGNMVKWAQRYTDIQTHGQMVRWSHGNMDTRTHGHMDTRRRMK
jgi:hypothetical protein